MSSKLRTIDRPNNHLAGKISVFSSVNVSYERIMDHFIRVLYHGKTYNNILFTRRPEMIGFVLIVRPVRSYGIMHCMCATLSFITNNRRVRARVFVSIYTAICIYYVQNVCL